MLGVALTVTGDWVRLKMGEDGLREITRETESLKEFEMDKR